MSRKHHRYNAIKAEMLQFFEKARRGRQAQ